MILFIKIVPHILSYFLTKHLKSLFIFNKYLINILGIIDFHLPNQEFALIHHSTDLFVIVVLA